MKTRQEVARFIEKLMDEGTSLPKICHHFGWCELKELMDFIYTGPPERHEECLNTNYSYEKRGMIVITKQLK